MFLRFYHLLSLSPDPLGLGTLLLALKYQKCNERLSWAALCQAPQASVYIQTQVVPALTTLPTLALPDEKLLQRLCQLLTDHPKHPAESRHWLQRLWSSMGPLTPALARLAVALLPAQPLIEIGGHGQLLATAWNQQLPAEPGWELWAQTPREAELARLYLQLMELEQCRIQQVSPAWPTAGADQEHGSIYLTSPYAPTTDAGLPTAIMAVPAKALLDQEETWCFWRECLPHVQDIWFFPQSDTALLHVLPGRSATMLWLYLDPGTLSLELACADAYHHQQGGPHRYPLSWQQWVTGNWASETKFRSAG